MAKKRNSKTDAPITPPNQQQRAQPSARRVAAREASRQRQTEQRRKRLLRYGAVALVAVAILALIGSQIYQDRQAQARLNDVETIEVPTADHVTAPVEYAQIPPAGGDHYAVWQNCGYYDQPLINEHAVHSMEHGAVWITYQPDLPADQVAILREKAESQSYVLVSPYPDLPSPVVASAWGHQLALESAEAEELDAFLRVYRQGSQTPEPGAACTGGTVATQ